MNHPFVIPTICRRAFLASLLPCSVLVAIARGEGNPLPDSATLSASIRDGFSRLNQRYYSPALGIWLDRPGDDLQAHFAGRRNPPWWPSANAVETLLDFMNAARSDEYDTLIRDLYTLQKDHRARRARVVAELRRRNQWTDANEQKWQLELQKQPTAPATGLYSDFQNEYLDDSGWWAIAWLKMHARTGEARFLQTARTIHAHMAKNWSEEKGGGVLWCEDADKQRPNAITNNLFLILSARLYQTTSEKTYLDWAEKTLAWLRSSALFNGSGVVDAPGHRDDYWTYNQGTYLGGLTALALAARRPELLTQAAHTADVIFQRSGLVAADGVVVEKVGIGGDATLFKGIFLRYLAQLHRALVTQNIHAETVAAIRRCIQSSVRSLLQHSVGEGGLYTSEWHQNARDRRENFNTQVSALAALTAELCCASK